MKNKNILIGVLGVLLVVLLIVGASVGGKDKSSATEKRVDSGDSSSILDNAQKESEAVSEDEMKDFVSININDYLDMKASDDKSIVLVARPTCHYCQIAEPILHKVAKEYDLDINYLNTDDFSQDDQTTFVKSDESFSEGYGTPMLLIVGSDSIIDRINGLTDHDHYVELLKNNGFVE